MFTIKTYKSSQSHRSTDLPNKKLRGNISEEKVYYLFFIPIFRRIVYSDCTQIV